MTFVLLITDFSGGLVALEKIKVFGAFQMSESLQVRPAGSPLCTIWHIKGDVIALQCILYS